MFSSNDPRVCREDFLSLFETGLFETDHVIAVRRWQRRTANAAMRLTDCRGNDG
jgi:hypothetical protein